MFCCKLVKGKVFEPGSISIIDFIYFRQQTVVQRTWMLLLIVVVGGGLMVASLFMSAWGIYDQLLYPRNMKKAGKQIYIKVFVTITIKVVTISINEVRSHSYLMHSQ